MAEEDHRVSAVPWTLAEPGQGAAPSGSTTPGQPEPASASIPSAAAPPPPPVDFLPGFAYPPAYPGLPAGSGQPLHPGDEPVTKRQVQKMLLFAVLFAGLCGLLGGLSGFASGYWTANRLTSDDTLGVSSAGDPGKKVQRPADSTAGVAARILPSVVSISAQGSVGESTGTGFVIRSDGYLLTNNHVVKAAANGGKLLVQFSNSDDPLPARLVGRSGRYDLAVLQVQRRKLPELPLGNSNDVAVGDQVIAVGSPLGLAGTVTTGVISAMNRPVTANDTQGGNDSAYIDALQTDAAINPGNSGGPLVDEAGKVIGVNSAIAGLPTALGGTSGSIGLGFAITIDQAKRTATEIINTGHATFPIIGVSLEPSSDVVGARIGTRAVDGVPPISADGPAAKAGLQIGDVITHFDGKRVHSSTELIVMISAKSPGDTVKITYRRGEASQDAQLVLGVGKDEA